MTSRDLARAVAALRDITESGTVVQGAIPLCVPLVRALGGANGACIAALVDQRCHTGGPGVLRDGDGTWWRAAMREIAEESGLTLGQVRRSLVRLIEMGVVLTAVHPVGEAFERTVSYRVNDR